MAFPEPPDKSAYYRQVWAIARQIPQGQVATYGQLAKLIPPPNGVAAADYRAFSPRWVGHAMAECPSDVPWQRVVNAQGKISDRRGAAKQYALLQVEGVDFVNQQIDLKQYQWRGPNATGPARQAKLF